ncbi:hypothetical protein Taro_009351 [Colocasia esculenta]|uniref:Uncharacterized protein n=1 Tax=Colocasia esculenta TaxID=4460 RepID=A0A843TW57_COLES|nr:hypothetical protein [Colocasia esculenta]
MTGRPGRPRAQARVFALARKDAEQAENITEVCQAVSSRVWSRGRGVRSPFVCAHTGRQEIDGKLVAIKILSWRQHRVPLTHLDGKDLAAKFFCMVSGSYHEGETGVPVLEEDLVRSDSGVRSSYTCGDRDVVTYLLLFIV